MPKLAMLLAALLPALLPQPPAPAPAPLPPAPDFDATHAGLTRVLERHVRDGGVDYAALKKDRAGLDAYLRTLESVEAADFRKWPADERMAFWINAYNAYTLKRVIDNHPIDSIKDVGSLFTSVWKQRVIPLGHLIEDGKRKKTSLDQIEHGVLRPTFRDARIHAAVNCASVSCPPLRREAFVAKRLDEQLDEQTRAWLADPSRNRFLQDKKRVELSRIFDWFKKDFEQHEGGLRAFLAEYAPAEHAQWIRAADELDVRYLDYDWGLNEAPKEERAGR